MSTQRNSAVNLDIDVISSNGGDGYSIAGGSTKRKLSVTAGDVNLVAPSGGVTATFPTTGNVTLVDSVSTQLIGGTKTFSAYPVGPGTSPGTPQTLADKAYVDNTVALGVNWLAPVINFQSAPPVSSTTGDRYLVLPTGTGAWSGHDNAIATSVSNGASWSFASPSTGNAVLNEANNLAYTYNGSAWVAFAAPTVYTGSLGVQLVGNDFRLNFSPNDGLKLVSTNILTVAYDNASIGIVSNNLAVKALGITNAMLAGSIDLTSKVINALPIGNGGTGQTSAAAGFNALNPMTTTGDLIYEVSSNTAARLPIGTNGQILAVNGSGIPAWTTIATGGGSVTSVGISGANGIGVTNSPITSSGIIALSLGAITPTSVNTGAGTINGLVLTALSQGFSIAGGTTSKTFSIGNSLTFAGTDATTITFQGSDTYVGRTTADTLTNKTIVSSTDVIGGVTMTLGSDATGDVYYRNSSGILTRLGLGSSGQVLGSNGTIPAWTTGGVLPVTQASTGQAMSTNTKYVVTAGSAITLSLPTSAAVGDLLYVVGSGAGLWTISQTQTSQQIHFGTADSASGSNATALNATHRRDAVTFMCTVANLEWTVIGVQGNPTINE